jgi:hypothetical protein
MAPIVYRRWFSFARRNRSKHPTQEDRIADLAKGIEAAFDAGGLYSPPGEMVDLARALAVVLLVQPE